jgi:TonB family protein
MSRSAPLAHDVFTIREIARASAAEPADVEALLASGAIASLDGYFVDAREAARAVRLLKGQPSGPIPERQLFRPLRFSQRRRGGPLTVSGLLHATAFGLMVLTTIGATNRIANDTMPAAVPRLVFLMKPGPGGGGGGGGLRRPDPPQRALLKGSSALKSPVPVERVVRKPDPPPPQPPKPVPPVETKPIERPAEPPPPVAKPDPVPPVVAPVVSSPADTRNQIGALPTTAPPSASQGSGNGGGAGTGSGTGIGEGHGAGIGDGSGAGTGGGPYRGGSGITPPQIVREVKPDYTEEARRRSVAGDVVLEIVVRSDGRVGDVKLLRGLGLGLDQKAIEAVRQWRFSPARRLGTPVDVIVEVAVEFRLR